MVFVISIMNIFLILKQSKPVLLLQQRSGKDDEESVQTDMNGDDSKVTRTSMAQVVPFTEKETATPSSSHMELKKQQQGLETHPHASNSSNNESNGNGNTNNHGNGNENRNSAKATERQQSPGPKKAQFMMSPKNVQVHAQSGEATAQAHGRTASPQHAPQIDSIYDLPAVATFDEALNAKQRYREQFGGSTKSNGMRTTTHGVSASSSNFDAKETMDSKNRHYVTGSNPPLSHEKMGSDNTSGVKISKMHSILDRQETVVSENPSVPPNNHLTVTDTKPRESASFEQPISPINKSMLSPKWKFGDIVDVIIREENNLVVQGVIRSWNPMTKWADIQVLPDKHHNHGGDMLRFIEVQDMQFTGLQLNDIAVLYFDDNIASDRQYPPGFMLPFEQLLEDKKFDEKTIIAWQNGTIPLPKPSALFNDIKIRLKSVSAEGLFIAQLLPNPRLDQYCISNMNIRVALGNIMSLEKHITFKRQMSARLSMHSGETMNRFKAKTISVNEEEDEAIGMMVTMAAINPNHPDLESDAANSPRAQAEAKEAQSTHFRFGSMFRGAKHGKSGKEDHELSYQYGMAGDVSSGHNRHFRTASGSIFMSFAADKGVIRNDLLARQYVMKMHYNLPRLCRLWIDLLLFLWTLIVALFFIWQIHHLPQMLSVSYHQQLKHSITHSYGLATQQYCNADFVPEYVYFNYR
ncbi:RmlC-like cupin family protein [Reticulomyxa filosa]|uniref:RmlC-like cupin family protein n=1 Tax=Reticulomyxa filosa TaxID=46433 RepID=X6MGS8_RETFI|nr:RmlC-like cupin family protein [Reticulomyxa filosa]|eukprot:ETO12627.1 RmlC-like cupin family protein [Reticulomyxa filosa]